MSDHRYMGMAWKSRRDLTRNDTTSRDTVSGIIVVMIWLPEMNHRKHANFLCFLLKSVLTSACEAWNNDFSWLEVAGYANMDRAFATRQSFPGRYSNA